LISLFDQLAESIKLFENNLALSSSGYENLSCHFTKFKPMLKNSNGFLDEISDKAVDQKECFRKIRFENLR
jgi:hypothetical protein